MMSESYCGEEDEEEAEEGPSPRNPKLRLEVFLRLFRIEEVSDGVADKMKSILNRLNVRRIPAGSVILREGDADAAHEMLIFTDGIVVVGGEEQLVLPSPFYIGEERVLKGSWPTATFSAKTKCRCYSLTSETVASLVLTGGFDLERILRLRAFERTLAMHGLHVSVLRDAVFVQHLMSFLLRRYSAENLRFLVDMMRFKRDVTAKDSFETVYARFSVLWDAYMRPWDDMSNVCALECPLDTVNQVTQAKEEACRSKSPKKLAGALDPLAIKVKSVVENDMLPAFVKSTSYVIFLRERFPHVEKDNKEAMSSAMQWTVGPTKVLKHLMEAGATDQQHADDDRDSHHHQRRRFSLSKHSHQTTPDHFPAASPFTDQQYMAAKNARSPQPSLQIKLSNMALELEQLDREAEDEIKKKAWRNPAANFLRWSFSSSTTSHSVQPLQTTGDDDDDVSTAFSRGVASPASSDDEDGRQGPDSPSSSLERTDGPRCVLS